MPDVAVETADELVASSAAFGSAVSCAQCLVELGADPAVAGPIAVLLGVAVRLGWDALRPYMVERWREQRRRKEAADGKREG